MKKYIELAKHLFELQEESLHNDVETHFLFNGWLEKFGKRSVEFEPEMQPTPENVFDLAVMIKEDFKTGYWTGDIEYNPDMIDAYGGFIDQCLENSLAILVGVGVQQELIFA